MRLSNVILQQFTIFTKNQLPRVYVKTEINDIMKQKTLTLLSTGFVWCLWGSKKTILELPILEVMNQSFIFNRDLNKNTKNDENNENNEDSIIYLKQNTIVKVDLKKGLHLVSEINLNEFLSAINLNNLQFYAKINTDPYNQGMCTAFLLE